MYMMFAIHTSRRSWGWKRVGVCLVGVVSVFGDTVHLARVAKQLKNNALMRIMNSFF